MSIERTWAAGLALLVSGSTLAQEMPARQVPRALAEWQERGDPIRGLREALERTGVLDG